jgi:hypothetical protein
MPSVVAVCVVWLALFVVVAALGSGAATRARETGVLARRVDQRLARVPLGGRVVAVLVVGVVVIVAVGWPLGLLAHALEGPVDQPVFRWFEARQDPDWSAIWLVLTDVGGLQQSRELVVLGAVVFAVVWAVRGRRWWVPPFVLVVGYLVEFYLQQNLQHLVDRGHPPTTLGSYPSGGNARVVLVYGLFAVFLLACSRTPRRTSRVAAAVVVALLMGVESYARTYNLEHWVTDVVGGLVFGVLLLVMMVTVFRMLDRPRAGARRARRAAAG